MAQSPRVDCGGKTIMELIWEELMVVYERLIAGPESVAEDGRDPGRAEGLATAIAILRNPYLPNVDEVREEAARRWEVMNGTPIRTTQGATAVTSTSA